MAKKIEIKENSVVITDTITGLVDFDQPKKDVYYSTKHLNKDTPTVYLYHTMSANLNSSGLFQVPLSDCVDTGEIPFTEESFRQFSNVNLGFSIGGAVSESGAENNANFVIRSVDILEYPTETSVITISNINDFKTECERFDHPKGTAIVLQEGFNLDSSDLTRRFDVNSSVIIRSENPNNKSSMYFEQNSSHLKFNAINCYLIDLVVYGDLTTISMAVPNTPGIVLENANNFECFNCEVYGFSYAAFDCKNSRNVTIHHNYIHECRREGLGYGTVLNGYSTVEHHHNEYDLNRHDIATGSDHPEQGYSVHSSYIRREGFPVHRFDSHAQPDLENPPNVLKNACAFMNIYNNYFETGDQVCIVTRGVQKDGLKVYGNTFCRPNRATAIRQTIFGVVIGANQEENVIDYDNLYITKIDDDISDVDDIYYQNTLGIIKHNMDSKENKIIASIPIIRSGGIIQGDFLGTNDLLLINGNRVQIYIDGFVNTIDITYNGNIDIVTKGRVSQDVKDELVISTDTGDVYSVIFDKVGNNPATAIVTLLLSSQNIKSIILGYYVDSTPLHDIILINNIDEFYILQNVAGVYGAPTQLTSAIDLTGFVKIFKMDLFNNGGTDDFVGLKNDSIYRFRMLGGVIRSGDPFLTTSPSPTNTDYFVKVINSEDRFFALNESGFVKIYKTASGFTSVDIKDVSYIGITDKIQS